MRISLFNSNRPQQTKTAKAVCDVLSAPPHLVTPTELVAIGAAVRGADYSDMRQYFSAAISTLKRMNGAVRDTTHSSRAHLHCG